MAKKVVRGVFIALGVVVAVIGIYLAYVMLDYYRLADKLMLETNYPAHTSTSLPARIDEEQASDLVIVSGNVGFGAYDPDFDFFMDGGSGSVAKSAEAAESNTRNYALAIKELDPDLILFQEVDIDGTRSHHVNEYDILRSVFAEDASVFAQNYDSPFLAWPPFEPHGANKAGMAVFSRFDITETVRRSLPISEEFGKFLDLDRCYTISRILTPFGAQLVIFNVHLSAYGADAQIMSAQREMLYEDMKRERDAGNYVIAGGDFNHDMIGISSEVFGNKASSEASWAKPFDFEGVPEGFTVACKAQLDAGQFKSAATCRDAGRPYDGTNDRWVMDAFIYSENIECLEQETLDLDFAYSDHNPVFMTFALEHE